MAAVLKREIAHNWEKTSASAPAPVWPPLEWPPLLSTQQMSEATDTTAMWTRRTLERIGELAGCAYQMVSYARVTADSTRRLIDEGQSQRFSAEDRQKLLRVIDQVRTTFGAVREFMDTNRDGVLRELDSAVHECNEIEEDGLMVQFKDEE